MSDPGFPSEEQGGYDPMPTSPDPLSPGGTPVKPENERGSNELPDTEGVRPLDEDDETGTDPQRIQEETDNAVQDKPLHPR